MRRRNTILALFIIVLIGLIGAIWSFNARAGVSRKESVAAQVENDLRLHLPLGSSQAQVVAYLDSKHISHGYIAASSMAVHSNCEIALVRDVAHTWLIRTDLQVYLMFDKNMKLAGYSMQEISTGP